MREPLKIGKTVIDESSPCYIIAEAGVNHNGDLDTALKLVRMARKIGADCVKFQTFKAGSVITKNAPKANYQLEVTDKQESQFEMLQKLELSWDEYRLIVAECNKEGITFLSTPYNEEDADFLIELNVPAFKIASGQIVEFAFLEHVARYKKPMILSTGMATLAEIYEAVSVIRSAGNDQLVVLQCTTNYPSLSEDANILAMNSMRDALNVWQGYSDHIEENYACYAAVTLGARIIEKHFTLDRNMPGPDHKASLNPTQFQELIQGIRKIETVLGSPVKTPSSREVENMEGMRRSIVLKQSLKKGEVITKENMVFKRPATGLSPKRKNELIGKRVTVNVPCDIPLKESMILWD